MTIEEEVNMQKRLIAFLLAVVLVCSCLPSIAIAADSQATTLTVAEVTAAPGTEVTLPVTVTGNPGILGAVLTVSWDEDLTLVADANGEAFEELSYQSPSRYVSGCSFVWYGSRVKEIKDGTILLLTFRVSETALDGKSCNVTITYDKRDILDKNYQTVDLVVENGGVQIASYQPGDVNGDERINPLDLIFISQYISDGCKTDPDGFNITLNELAADVNNDGRINPLDLIFISQYISDGCKTDPDGFNVTLQHSRPACSHNNMMQIDAKAPTCTEDGNIAYRYCTGCNKYFAGETGMTEIEFAQTGIPAEHRVETVAAKAPTCTADGNIAYWQCSECGKCFDSADAENEIELSETIKPAEHTLTYVPRKEATKENDGCIEHYKCSVCGKYFRDILGNEELKESELYFSLAKSTVSYNVYGSDKYLEKVGVDNTMNPSVFYARDGLTLNDLEAPDGYIFMGWRNANGEPIEKIEPSNDSRRIVVNAVWEKVEYTIQFDSPDVPVENKTYTVDTGAILSTPSHFGYTFVGWSNDDGFLISEIKPGTTGNINLHANWTSNRNKATSYADYGDPITIIEDDRTGQYLFVYRIGKIDNVPLNVIDKLGNFDRINIKQTYTITEKIESTEAKNIAEMISKATTESSGWTLSEDWESIYSAGSETDETRGKTQERTDSQGNTVGGNYYVSNSQGGATHISSNSGGSNTTSAKVTKNDSVGIHENYKESTETDSSVKLGMTNELIVAAGVSYGVVSAGVKNTNTISMETEDNRNQKQSYELDTQSVNAIGTVDERQVSTKYDITTQSDSTWNSNAAYEKSYETSQDSVVSNLIAEQIAEKTSLNVSKSAGAQMANSSLSTDSSEKLNEYSTTFGYFEGTETTTEKSVEFASDCSGYYRLVSAGTVHVFGVVGYDVATDSYFTYTYSLLDDERHPYLDYSKGDPNFADCQNAVVPFEVPFYPHEYITAVTGRSEGLEVDLDGYITGYTGTNSTVLIPQYWQVDNGDGTFSAVKVRGIADNYVNVMGQEVSVFAGNTNIQRVILPAYVTEIPDSAFENCTSLTSVFAPGVTNIGENAFKGCSSLETFTLDEYVTGLGENAFSGVNKLVVMAANEQVVEAVIRSGAKSITLNLSKLTEPIQNKKLTVSSGTDYFALAGNGTAHKNLQIVSEAGETCINNIIFAENLDTPLTISSAKVTLNRVTVQETYGFALILKNENTAVTLYGNVKLSSKGENTVLCRNMSLARQSATVSSKLESSGNVLICGQLTDPNSLLRVATTAISEDVYSQYTGGHVHTAVKGFAATCTDDGLTDGVVCSRCGAWIVQQTVIEAKGHKEEQVPEKAATCTGNGITAGTKCSVCGVTLSGLETIPAKGHTEVVVKGSAATCTATGKTDGKKCSVCGTVTVAQQTIPAKGHTEVVVKGYAATCTATGKTDGKKCSVCGTVTVAQQTIPAKGHTEVVVKGYAATCTTTGKTDGKKCTVCNATTVYQQTISALGHSYSQWKVEVAATCAVKGLETRTCSRCLLKESQEIPATGDHDYDYNNVYCSACDAVYEGTPGLKIEKGDAEGSYYVVNGLKSGYYNVNTIYIPAYYDGKPVRVIKAINYSAKVVYVPDTVIQINWLSVDNVEAFYVSTTGWKEYYSVTGNLVGSVDFSNPMTAAYIINNTSGRVFKRVE